MSKTNNNKIPITTNQTSLLTKNDKINKQNVRFSFPSISGKQIKKQTHWTRTSYFAVRHEKLVTQAPEAKTRLFENIRIYCTGVRSYSQRRLESLVWKNGGIVHKNMLRTQITHVIADNLCASKMQRELMMTMGNGKGIHVVIVKPQWILDCIQQGKILATWKYQVVKTTPGFRTIDTFFPQKSIKDKNEKERKNITTTVKR